MQKIIADVESYLVDKKKNNNAPQKFFLEESFLVIGLKKQVSELKEQLQEKDNEIAVFKKSSKVLKINELEMELQTYIQEANRLRSYLDQLGSSNKYYSLSWKTFGRWVHLYKWTEERKYGIESKFNGSRRTNSAT